MEKGILWWDLTRPHFAETGACDLMEEHFRKSLGADYSKLFKEKPEKVAEKEEEEKMEVDPVKAFKDDLDMSGYTGIAACFLSAILELSHLLVPYP